mgnify:CR=1 FL=1
MLSYIFVCVILIYITANFINHTHIANRYMAPQGFPERDIALHSAVLSFPHPVGGQNVVCVAAVPPHWEARYGEEVTSDIAKLCLELKTKYSS